MKIKMSTFYGIAIGSIIAFGALVFYIMYSDYQEHKAELVENK